MYRDRTGEIELLNPEDIVGLGRLDVSQGLQLLGELQGERRKINLHNSLGVFNDLTLQG